MASGKSYTYYDTRNYIQVTAIYSSVLWVHMYVVTTNTNDLKIIIVIIIIILDDNNICDDDDDGNE